MTLTQDELKRVLDYDPETGVFRWAMSPNVKIKIGDVAGYTDPSNGYVRLGYKKKIYRVNRLAWLYVYGQWPTGDVDHKDRDKQNNKISNLRDTTKSNNLANSRLNVRNSSCLKGVHWRKQSGKWHAQISIKGIKTHIGLYSTKEEAYAAYCEAAVKHFGDFARIK